jgi:hypothetical protein
MTVDKLGPGLRSNLTPRHRIESQVNSANQIFKEIKIAARVDTQLRGRKYLRALIAAVRASSGATRIFARDRHGAIEIKFSKIKLLRASRKNRRGGPNSRR